MVFLIFGLPFLVGCFLGYGRWKYESQVRQAQLQTAQILAEINRKVQP